MASETALKDGKNPTSTQNKRVDWKKQKELEEARKAGTAPPEVDEEGRYYYFYLLVSWCFLSVK